MGLIRTAHVALWFALVFWYSCFYEQFDWMLPPNRVAIVAATVPMEAGTLNATGACVCCLQFFRCDSTCLGFVKEKGASSICLAFVGKSA